MDDLRQMRVLLAIAEEKSVRRAAESLRLTHGTVSRTLSRLEDVYGAKLFHRSKRQMDLTEAGGVLVRAARETVDRFEDAARAIRDIEGRHRLGLTIAADSTLTLDLLLPVLSERMSGLGDTRIDVRTGDWPTMRPLLVRGDVDLFLGVLPDEPLHDFNTTFLPVLQPVLVVHKDHPLTGKGPIPFTAIQDYPGITTRIPEWVRDIVYGALDQPEKFHLAISDNWDLIYDALCTKHAVSGGTPNFFSAPLKRGDLVTLDFEDNPFQGQFRAVAVTRPGDVPAAIQEFLDVLLRRAREDAAAA